MCKRSKQGGTHSITACWVPVSTSQATVDAAWAERPEQLTSAPKAVVSWCEASHSSIRSSGNIYLGRVVEGWKDEGFAGNNLTFFILFQLNSCRRSRRHWQWAKLVMITTIIVICHASYGSSSRVIVPSRSTRVLYLGYLGRLGRLGRLALYLAGWQPGWVPVYLPLPSTTNTPQHDTVWVSALCTWYQPCLASEFLIFFREHMAGSRIKKKEKKYSSPRALTVM